MKKVAEAQSRVVGVPVVVQPVPVHHNLATVLDEIRDIQVAVMVLHEIYGTSSIPLPLEYLSGLYRIWHRNALKSHTKYIHFL
ncbi:MAG: hypothetical protein QG589_426 [Patescibacteria group bacterium]|nr:hypothetical protein [Patescibacteria group bacterium]